MARLIVHVEGVTEEEFVDAVLQPHLLACGWVSVSARRMGSGRTRDQRHGIKGWDVARAGIIRQLQEDGGCYVTTLVDYYGLPQRGARAWPGRAAAGLQPIAERGSFIEQALHADLAIAMGNAYAASRFLPFVLMHEFEALLFSDCLRFAQGIGRPAIAAPLQLIRNGFATPEEIDDSPLTSPSKRIETLIPDYEKPLLGVLAALEIGLDAIRRDCPHFCAWLEQLEAWPQ
jgi:hypothetical protein